MFNFFQHIYHTGQFNKIQNGDEMEHFLVCYIGHHDILSQKIRQIQAYHRKTYCDFNIQRCYSSQQKNHFCHTKLQSMIIEVVLSKFLYLIANRTSYPKPIKEALAILKISIGIIYHQLL